MAKTVAFLKGSKAKGTRASERQGSSLAGARDAASVPLRSDIETDSADRHYWLEAMINHIPDYIYAKDIKGRFLVANSVTVRDNGFADLKDLVGKTDFDLHPHGLAASFAEIERRVLETDEPVFGIEERAAVDKGVERWLMTSKVPLRNKQGKTIGTVGVSRDITDRKRAERLMMAQARLLEMVVKSVPLDVFFEELIHLIESHLPGMIGSVLTMSPDRQHLVMGAAPNLDQAYGALLNGMEIGAEVGSCGAAAFRNEAVNVADIGTHPLWAPYKALVEPFGFKACWSMPIRSYTGDVLGTFGLYAPRIGLPSERENELILMAAHLAGIAIERKQSEERIQFMAHHDALTGLPNRVLFDQQMERALVEARQNGHWLALAFLDLDHFKLINDSLGHHTGDALLQAVAGRMLHCVRRTDMIVRVGGDEFIILLTALPQERDLVLSRFEEIRATIGAPLVLEDRTLRVSCSMGVVCYPDHGETAAELMANADAAMYRAKELGRNNLQLFSTEMAEKAHAKLLRHEELRDAVAREEFVLHYQPQFDLTTGRIFAAESLLRWRHPTRGLVSPADFIPLAEETGLIVPIGDWVLSAACRQNKAWQDAGLPPIVISVNVSARQFREADWVARVAAALVTSGLEARYLELELTESLIMQDVAKAIATMHELEALGVHLAIDDFGTGYSSLSALKRFPVRRLKIDRSFIQDIPGDEEDMAITAAIISLAQKLQLSVIAEGVESQAQVDFLRQAGCNEIQGYFISRPLAAAGFVDLLAAGGR